MDDVTKEAIREVYKNLQQLYKVENKSIQDVKALKNKLKPEFAKLRKNLPPQKVKPPQVTSGRTGKQRMTNKEFLEGLKLLYGHCRYTSGPPIADDVKSVKIAAQLGLI